MQLNANVAPLEIERISEPYELIESREGQARSGMQIELLIRR